MTGPFVIHHYPVFEKGTFEKQSTLVDQLLQQIPAHSNRYRISRETLREYEGSITWPVIVGPGFCGGTHPGADNVFLTAMLSSNKAIYNSDCLYVNPTHKVFAISDAPEITTMARRLITKLDCCLQEGSVDDLEAVINGLSVETMMGGTATLSLICFPKNKLDDRLNKARAFVAGDTYLFHGNKFQRRLTRVKGSPAFIGTPHVHLEPILIDLAEGDFLVIASDGILSIRANGSEMTLEELLLDYAVGDMENFASKVIMSCNMSLEERICDRVTSRFGGSDNVSALLVYPDKLMNISGKESFILGGYVFEA